MKTIKIGLLLLSLVFSFVAYSQPNTNTRQIRFNRVQFAADTLANIKTGYMWYDFNTNVIRARIDTVTRTIAPISGANFGNPGEIAYVNDSSDGFSYDTNLVYYDSISTLHIPANIIVPNLPANDNSLTAILGIDNTTGEFKYRSASTLGTPLTDGSGTTAAGSGVNIGGNLSVDAVINVNGNGFQVRSSSNNFIDHGSSGVTTISANNANSTITAGFGNKINIHSGNAGNSDIDVKDTGYIDMNCDNDLNITADSVLIHSDLSTTRLKIASVSNNDTLNQLLARDFTTGEIKYRKASTFTGITGSLTSGRVTISSGTNTVTDSNAFTYSSGTIGLGTVVSGTRTIIQPNAIELYDSGISGLGIGSNGGNGIITANNDLDFEMDGDFRVNVVNAANTIKFSNNGSPTTFIIANIPTSAAGLPSGSVWSNLGVLTIVP